MIIIYLTVILLGIVYALLAWAWMSQCSVNLSEQLFTSNESDFLMLIVALFAYLGAIRFASYALIDNKSSESKRETLKKFLGCIELPDTIYCILSMIVLYDLSIIWALNASQSFLPELPDSLKVSADYFILIRTLLICGVLISFFYASFLLMKNHLYFYSSRTKTDITGTDNTSNGLADSVSALAKALTELSIDKKHMLSLIAEDSKTNDETKCKIYKYINI
ncbi:hypothetical protein A1359_16045 [Methylomonas lenta]|uniref:Uncharacterized protein n=1 Tax=Methylomonas lenta TaxID=980561 RepID=A0A177MZE1_9GAMM|nr:hypothetical protein [Methylomonas lenta]OAI10764.1 hypothetical protein A1359_16045 [Methylomonas lenta]